MSSALIERAHVDALILATLSELKVPATAKKSATIRASFGAKTKLQLAATLKAVPALAAIKPNSSWREPVIAAVSDLPA